MITMQQTSIETYFNHVKPKLGERQRAVLEAIEELEPCTNKQLARHLQWEINSITPRVLELRKLNKVVEYGRIKDVNGRPSMMWSTPAYKAVAG